MTPAVIPAEYYQRDRDIHPPAHVPGYKTSVPRSPRQALLSLERSLSEITGPTFGHADLGPLDNDLIRNYAKTGDPVGERIIVHGRVLDEDARPVAGTLVQVWQANAGGRSPTIRATTSSAQSNPVPILGATTSIPGGPRISMSRSLAAPLHRD